VTGRWDIAFAGPDSGAVTFVARALDANGRELATTRTTSQVVSPVAAAPRPSASPSPSPSEPEPSAGDASDEPVEESAADTPATRESEATALQPAAGTPSVLGPGLIIGGVLVFLGVALLIRLRSRSRRQPAWQTRTQMLPTGFDSMPRHPGR
jgi:uncharacterized membrane protein